jgi:hypothetical protein
LIFDSQGISPDNPTFRSYHRRLHWDWRYVRTDRFAKRGHDLVLVARDHARMEALAERLRRETGLMVDILQADLTEAADNL